MVKYESRSEVSPQRPLDAPDGLRPKAVGAVRIAGEGTAGFLVLRDGGNRDDGERMHPQVGSIEASASAIRARAVESGVLHQRFAYVQ